MELLTHAKSEHNVETPDSRRFIFNNVKNRLTKPRNNKAPEISLHNFVFYENYIKRRINQELRIIENVVDIFPTGMDKNVKKNIDKAVYDAVSDLERAVKLKPAVSYKRTYHDIETNTKIPKTNTTQDDVRKLTRSETIANNTYHRIMKTKGFEKLNFTKPQQGQFKKDLQLIIDRNLKTYPGDKDGKAQKLMDIILNAIDEATEDYEMK